MADCRFCGKPAGLFRKQHAECEVRRSNGVDRIQFQAEKVAAGTADFASLSTALEKSKNDFVSDSEARIALVRGWEAAVERFLDDGLLEAEEENHLALFQKQWTLEQNELDGRGALTKVVQAGALRDITEGRIPSRVTVFNGNLPFNFQKGEQLVWVFQNVEYLEDKTRREYVGRSTGVSVRVAKGVYLRSSAFRGHPIERTERVSLGRGLLAVTTKHVYFTGAKSFRVRHDKIVTYIPFSNGVGIVKDSATAKPQIFNTGDGWFINNLLANIGQL